MTTQKQIEKEFMAGFNDGMLHNADGPLCLDIIRKAKSITANTNAPLLIREYWRGYLEGVSTLIETPEAG